MQLSTQIHILTTSYDASRLHLNRKIGINDPACGLKVS